MLRNRKSQTYSYKKQETSCNLQFATCNSQSGNVFIIILVAIVLFGALIFTFSRSGSQGVSSISKQEAKIAAQEILSYARLVEGAVDRVRRNGCSETEISFENAVVAGYSNPNSPSDHSCHIFDDAGGKIPFKTVLPSYLITPTSNNAYDFKGLFQIDGVGTPLADLIIQKGNLSQELCRSINLLLNVETSPNPPIDDSTGGSALFTGSFGSGVADTLNDENAELFAKRTACIYKTSADNYKLYHVLLAR